MPVRVVAGLALVALALLPNLWGFLATAVLLLRWQGLASKRATGPDTGTFVALALYAGLLAIVLVTVRAAFGWLERPMISLQQTGIAPHFGHGSMGFYDKSELRFALLEWIVLWVSFAAMLAAMWRDRARPLHPLSAAFALVLYFSTIALPPYSTGLGPALAVMIGRLVAGAAMFVLIRKVTGSRAVALLGASWVLLVAPATDGPPSHWLYIGALLYLGFVLRRFSRGRHLAPREVFVGACLVIAIGCTWLSADWALQWVLTPATALVGYGLIRRLSIRYHGAVPARGFVPLAFCALFNVIFPIDRLNERISSYTTRYEPAREAWYRQCARGGECDPARKPSLAASFREAKQ